MSNILLILTLMVKKLKKEIFSETVRLKIILQGFCPRADHIESLVSRNLEHPRHFTIPNHGYQLINAFNPAVIRPP